MFGNKLRHNGAGTNQNKDIIETHRQHIHTSLDSPWSQSSLATNPATAGQPRPTIIIYHASMATSRGTARSAASFDLSGARVFDPIQTRSAWVCPRAPDVPCRHRDRRQRAGPAARRAFTDSRRRSIHHRPNTNRKWRLDKSNRDWLPRVWPRRAPPHYLRAAPRPPRGQHALLYHNKQLLARSFCRRCATVCRGAQSTGGGRPPRLEPIWR